MIRQFRAAVPRTDVARNDIDRRVSFWEGRVPAIVAREQAAWERAQLIHRMHRRVTNVDIGARLGINHERVAQIYQQQGFSQSPVARYLEQNAVDLERLSKLR